MSIRDDNKRVMALTQEFQKWQTTLQDIQTYIMPTRGYFAGVGIPNDGTKINHTVIINDCATKACRTLAAGLVSGMTSPSRPWFKLDFPDEEINQVAGVREWIDRVQTLIYSILAKSNIYQALTGVYEEIGSFGTSAIMLLEDYDSVLRAETFTVGDYLLGYGPDGRLNTLAREFQIQVSQMVEKFGLEKCSETVRTKYKNQQFDAWINCKMLIEPNALRVVGRADAKNKKYRAVYWESSVADGSAYLRESGHDRFPVLAIRWGTRTSRDCYGFGPGWDALGSAKQIQTMEADVLDGANKLYNPPLQAPSSIQNQGGVISFPGGITWKSDTDKGVIEPLYKQDPNGVTILQNKIEKIEMGIRATFFADLFLMLSQTDMPEMTAREVVERHEEKLLALGPVLESMKEFLDQLIDYIFDTMIAVGMVPDPPPEIEGMELKVDYISILAQAQKMVGTAAIREVVGFASQLVPVAPEILDNIDLDEAIDQYGSMVGLPAKIIRSDETVAKIRKVRAQAQAQAEQLQKTALAVEGAQKLSQTPTDGNTALAALMGGNQ